MAEPIEQINFCCAVAEDKQMRLRDKVHWLHESADEYLKKLDESRAALAASEASQQAMRLERDLSDKTIRAAADTLRDWIVEDDVAVDALVLAAVDRLLAAQAASEASQRAMREALETTAIEESRAFGWICVLCGISYMRRELMVHRPTCLLAATSTAALGTGTTQRLGTVTGVDADGNTQIHTVMHAPDCDWSRCEGCGPQQREATS